MALPAFKNLKLTIKNYVDNPFLGVSVAPQTREILEFAYDQVQSCEEIARKMLLSSTSRLDLEIRVGVAKLLHKMYSMRDMRISSNSPRRIEFPMDELEDLNLYIRSFAGMLRNMAAEFPVAGEDDDTAVSSSIDEPKMVGLSDQYQQLKDRVTRPTGLIVPLVVVVVGMPGIGKTTLARHIFEDPDTVTRYDCRVWITVGRKCQLKEIPRRILAAVNPAASDQILDDEEIARRLRESLEGKRYLIVLDDVWNRYMACHFIFYSEYNSFKYDRFPKNGVVVITTRLHQEEMHEGKFPDCVVKIRLLDNEESWDLLREKVFGEDQSCPPQLEEAGKKIAENCEGLPLTIITVADLLSKEEKKMPEYWRDVAAKKNHKIFMDAYNKISPVLYSSYEELTHVLKLCFLYMGIFPQNFEIPRSKVINMWSVDGFIEANAHKFQCPSALECLDELVSNSLVMIYQSTIASASAVGRHQIKTCGLHSSLWHLSRREATQTKFCHVLNVLDDCSVDYLEGQSRLSFHNNILFGIKGLCELVEDKCASCAHSLLCYGSYQPYQVPICYGLNMLRELDALTLRFYEFPTKVLELVELKYLALTLNGELPASIAKLSKLHFLIVDRHMSIRSCGESSYLPKEIWDMKELKHLQVMGRDLPDPCGSLESLSTLSNVGARSCRDGVLKAIPNLRKLGIRIELVPNDGGECESTSSLSHVCHLEKLDSLKCEVVNPDVTPPLALPSIFPSNLRKLSLSGLGYPWEEMNKLASLLFLETLKLRNYAFRGPKWEVKGKNMLHNLESLVIEDTDLEEWTIGSDSLTRLQSLRVKHCYKLRRICWESDRPSVIAHWACHNSLEKIELVDCNPSGIEQMKKALPHWKEDALAVHSSWEDEKLKT